MMSAPTKIEYGVSVPLTPVGNPSAETGSLGSGCSPADVPLRPELWEVDPVQPPGNEICPPGVYTSHHERGIGVCAGRHGANPFRVGDGGMCESLVAGDCGHTHFISHTRRMRPKAHAGEAAAAVPMCKCGKPMVPRGELHNRYSWVCMAGYDSDVPLCGLAATLCCESTRCSSGWCAKHIPDARAGEPKVAPRAAHDVGACTYNCSQSFKGGIHYDACPASDRRAAPIAEEKSKPIQAAPAEGSKAPRILGKYTGSDLEREKTIAFMQENRDEERWERALLIDSEASAKPARLEPSRRYPESNDLDQDIENAWELSQ